MNQCRPPCVELSMASSTNTRSTSQSVSSCMDFSTSAAFLPNLDSLNTRTKKKSHPFRIRCHPASAGTLVCPWCSCRTSLRHSIPQLFPVSCNQHIPSAFLSAPPDCTLLPEQPWKSSCKYNISFHFWLLTFCSYVCYKSNYIGFPVICQHPKITFLFFFGRFPKSSVSTENISLFLHTMTQKIRRLSQT